MPHTFKLYNSLSGKKETLKPLKENEVSMYCCGVTPYSNTHIGHLRTFFCYDILHKALVDCGYDVKWARNITDIDDKIIKKAAEENVSCSDIVNKYVQEQDHYLHIFGLEKPPLEPKVTETVPEIIAHISNLIEHNIAYATASGVYFRVSKFPEYGKLSKNKIADLRNGVRIDVDETKEDALDFALWKIAKPGEQNWPSPWGNGRPGWHIECSAMIYKHLGKSIDIHMGGRDLIFPHHECEIAQSESYTHLPLASLWMHTGMVTANGEKMSKSLNNFVSISDFLDHSHADVMRLMILSTTYSQALDFSYESTEEIQKKLLKLVRFRSLIDDLLKENTANQNHDVNLFEAAPELISQMQTKFHDDLNTPGVLASLFEFIKGVNSKLSLLLKKGLLLNSSDKDLMLQHWPKIVKWIQSNLGLLVTEADELMTALSKRKNGTALSKNEIAQLLQGRETARQQKNWAESDRIRNELQQHGILIQDTPNGPRWTLEI